ncbi:hypothetical protein K9L67_00330 [Candidatus Woesearchaeota archaeon]|nr:hypothetical protein [Candidatus Woesearchaeota archaeon]MCF7900653.1 hypothetical protein [Candidatus Woesearchaeota archaeon]MCF8013512.1 hypothetical protein [Candidatus Woesearchaeota archaeon]
MDKSEFISKYNILKEQHQLPNLSELDKEFFVEYTMGNWRTIPENTLIFTMNLIMDYYIGWINFCHTLINGNPQSMILMREAEFFSNEEKKEIIKVMQNLTIISRKQTIINLKNEEKETAQFIKEIFESWKNIKPKLLKYADHSHKKWLEEK